VLELSGVLDGVLSLACNSTICAVNPWISLPTRRSRRRQDRPEGEKGFAIHASW
jgi:hypothetical protein